MNNLHTMQPDPPSLGDLLPTLAPLQPRLIGDSRVTVRDVRHDSREVEPGDLFVARPGTRTDGARFVEDAVARGARAVIVAHGLESSCAVVPSVAVSDPMRALALVAEAVQGWPTRSLSVVGVTGTNGKTTVAWLVQQALLKMGLPAARVGTLGFDFPGLVAEGGLTTPEPDDLSRFARRVVDAGGRHLVMEVSSHALERGRVDALHFEVAAFTNLTQDHLDFHGTMSAYGAAKKRLFTDVGARWAVVNMDDPFGAKLAAELTPMGLLRVSREGNTAAEVRAEAVTSDAQGIRGTVLLPTARVRLESALVGDHNLENLLVSLAVAQALGVEMEPFANALSCVPAAPGRLERCDDSEDDVTVLVDYSHTPDALVRALAAVRGLTRGRIHCVFGCGGDRDPGKRPKMGAAVGAGADVAYLTNDNPRSEAPEAIASAVEPALAATKIDYVVELNRARAIERAILSAAPGDVVLIAGKGHETYQILGPRTIHFDDREESRRALAKRRLGSRG